jgi:glycosyltransferase involved in cell wall biosynthesis
MMPTISVVIPAYNAESTILETISSVQQQTLSDVELIVINDGSTDRTPELLHTIKDSRLRIFSYENGGLCVARNRGISHATGEFISFLDADDLWTPDKLELQLAALQQHPDAGVAYSWTYFMDEKEGSRSFHPCEPVFIEGKVYAELLVKNFIASGSNVLIRRQAVESVGEFDPKCEGTADWDYWLRLATNWSFVVVPELQVFYRRSSGSMSSKVEKMKKEALIVLEKAYQAAPQNFQHLKKKSLAWIYQYCTDSYLRHSTDMKGIQQAGWHLYMAIRLQPKTLLEEHNQNLIKWFFKRWILMKFSFLENYWGWN